MKGHARAQVIGRDSILTHETFSEDDLVDAKPLKRIIYIHCKKYLVRMTTSACMVILQFQGSLNRGRNSKTLSSINPS